MTPQGAAGRTEASYYLPQQKTCWECTGVPCDPHEEQCLIWAQIFSRQMEGTRPCCRARHQRPKTTYAGPRQGHAALRACMHPMREAQVPKPVAACWQRWLPGTVSCTPSHSRVPSPDLPQGNSSRPVAVRLLDTTSGRGRLAGSLGGQLLPGGLATSGLARCLLSTSHNVRCLKRVACEKESQGEGSIP